MTEGLLTSNVISKEMRNCFQASIDHHYGSTHYSDCWRDHWPCALKRTLDEIDRLQSENTTFRNAQKACADCDGPTMERVRQIEAELAEMRKAISQWRDWVDGKRHDLNYDQIRTAFDAALKEPT